MDVKYDYDLDRLIEYGITDNQSFVDAIVKEALPILPVHILSLIHILDQERNEGSPGRNREYGLRDHAWKCWEFPAEYGDGRAIKIKFIRKIRNNYGIAALMLKVRDIKF